MLNRLCRAQLWFIEMKVNKTAFCISVVES